MSYSNDQWHNLQQSDHYTISQGKNDAGYYLVDSANEEFVYPTRRVRTLGRGTGTGLFGNAQVNNVPISTTLKRGYMRSLIDEVGYSGGNPKKVQFQFNPAAINQSVAQNTALLNFLQADVAQYTQPIPGLVTFQFSTFFDRTMDVANRSNEGLQPDSDNPWETSSPGQVGVLHDLAALFSIIGVGVSEYMADTINQKAENLAEADLFQKSVIEAFIEQTEDRKTTDFLDSFSKLVAVNKGNSAFLIPLPVRIVFSSLYIVEGLVQDIDVLYTKFSTNMVPIQASVNLTLEAKYIGFAKKDTFYTKSLNALPDYAANQQSAINESKGEVDTDYLSAVAGDLSNVQMYIVASEDRVGENADEATKLDPSSDDLREDHTRFSRVVSTSGTDNDFATQEVSKDPGSAHSKHIRLLLKDADMDSPQRIAGIYGQGTNVSVTFTAQAALWRLIGFDPNIAAAALLTNQSKSQLLNVNATGSNGTISVNQYTFDRPQTVKNLMQEVIDGTPIDVTPINNSTKRRYETAKLLWTAQLDSSNMFTGDDTATEGVVTNTITTLDDWRKLDRTGETPFYLTSSPGAYFVDDRSRSFIDDDNGQQSVTIETAHGWEYYLMYSLTITVATGTSDPVVRTTTVLHHYPSVGRLGRKDDFNNDIDFSMIQIMAFDWEGDPEN